MKIPRIFGKKKQDGEYYVGLFLKHSDLEVFLYQIRDGSLAIISHKKRDFSNSWDNLTEDADEALFSIEQETKKSFEKVILFIHSHLVNRETKQIDEPYKGYIKKLLKQLELKPLGYIECYEAVVSHLEKQDHTLLNAILFELDGEQISSYLYIGGRQVYQDSQVKKEGLVDHIDAEFKRMKQDAMLPSRVILFGEHEYQAEVDEVCSHHFENKHFIQRPRVEFFSTEELAKALQETFKDQIAHQPEHTPEVVKEDKIPDVYVPPDENFEIIDRTETPAKEKKEVMGFMIGEDIGVEKSTETMPSYEQETAIPEVNVSDEPRKKSISDFVHMARGKAMIGAAFLKKKLLLNKQKKLPLMIGAGALVLLLVIFSLEYFFHKTELTVFFPSQSVTKNLSIPAVLGDNEINLQVGTVSAQVSNKKATTGKRDVGEKAKGEVTIHNFEDREHVFAKGTAMTAENQSFVLDQEVKVASASIVLISGSPVKQPGKAKGAVIAAEIGPAGNLDKNKKFQIENISISTYFGLNDEPLTGGSKKEVKTVAKADIDELRKLAIEKGSAQAEADLQKVQSTQDEQVLGSLTESSPKKLDFSKEVGEEATELKLDATIGVTYYTYSSKKLKEFVRKSLESDVRDGFILPSEKVVLAIKEATADADLVTMDVDAEGKAMRKFSRNEILKKVAGKNQSQLESILKNDLKAAGFEVKTTSSPIFFLTGRMPFAKRNIVIKIDSL